MPGDSTTQLRLLLERLPAGDVAARDELLERACARLRRLTRRIFQDFARVHRFEDTDDVLQAVLLRMTRRLDGCMGQRCADSDRPPLGVPEFFRLASSEIRQALLDLARKYFGPQGPARHEVPQADRGDGRPDLDPGDSTLEPRKPWMWTEFHRQVEQLPPALRDVFELRWYQGLSSEEASRVLDLSLATFKRRWLEARLLLAPLLEPALSKR